MKKWKRDQWRREKHCWQRRKKEETAQSTAVIEAPVARTRGMKVIGHYFHLFYLKLNGIFRFKNKNQ
jgi:hypothetical protein